MAVNQKRYFCRVKFTTAILYLYILLLPCLPCMDKDECSEKATTTAGSTASHHRDHEDEEEGCTPFCSCVCCGHIFTPSFAEQKPTLIPTEAIKKQPSFYKNISLPADFFGNIWQPPKWC